MVTKKRRLVVQIGPGVCEEHRLDWCARISRKWRPVPILSGKPVSWTQGYGHDMRFRRLDGNESMKREAA